MNRTISMVIMWVIAISFPVSALTADLKIGVVNAAKVLDEAPQMEVARQEMEREFEPRKKDIDAQQKKLRKQEEKLNRDSAIMSENERRKLERDVRTRQRELKRMQEEFREDVNIRRNDVFDKVRRQVRAAVNAVGKRGKFDLILNDEILFHFSDRMDITNAVIKELKVIQSTKSTTKSKK